MKILLVEAGYARRLSANTRELLEYSASLPSLAERHAARTDFFAELKAQGRIMLAPKPGQDPTTLYTVDSAGAAHINIVGQLTPVAEQDVCGGYTADALTEYGYITAATEAASADPRVKSITYNVSSPGGYLAGLFGALRSVASAGKPTRAVVGDMAASAAYWLASATQEIQAESPASRFGSIGVLAEDFNADRALADAGIDHTVFTSTDAPLKYADTSTAEGRAQVVAELDQLHAVFRSQVAEGRGVTPDKVNSDFGRGALMTAEAALSAGMIDGIASQPALGKTGLQIQKKNGAVGASAGRPITSQGKNMKTLEELKAENPALYELAIAAGREQGVKAEQDRNRDLVAWYGHNAACDAIVDEARAQGTAFADVHSRLAAAAAKGPTAQPAGGANPPKVATAQPKNPSGAEAVDDNDPASDAAFLAMAAKNGYTAEQAQKYLGKGA